MVMPPPIIIAPRNPPPAGTSHRLLPYLALVIFSAIFVFKVDVLISQSVHTPPRRNHLHTTTTSSTRGGIDVAKVANPNGTFHRHFLHSWGEDRARILEDGEVLTLSLDKLSGSGIESRRTFMFAKVDMQIKLIPGNSAGTVTTYYLSSEGERHDEIDFEFLGNSTGNPYTLHTNVYCQGKGDREQQFYLWFDPTQDFHTYTILWNPKNIIFFVDGVPIRQFKNMEKHGIPYPKEQPMRLYSSLWNADEWATQGGRVKTDWNEAPFVAYYKNFSVDGCTWSYRSRSSSCSPEDMEANNPVMEMELDRTDTLRMKKVQRDFMVYNYCRDTWRFPEGPALECKFEL